MKALKSLQKNLYLKIGKHFDLNYSYICCELTPHYFQLINDWPLIK